MWLEPSRQLQAFGRPATRSSGLVEAADWTLARQGKLNEPLTLFALIVLKAAGRA